MATHYPCCKSLRSDFGYGGRVDVEALGRGEQVTYRDQDGDLIIVRSLDEIADQLAYCGCIDVSVAIVDLETDWPASWACPECGGTEFEAIHADNIQIDSGGAGEQP